MKLTSKKSLLIVGLILVVGVYFMWSTGRHNTPKQVVTPTTTDSRLQTVVTLKNTAALTPYMDNATIQTIQTSLYANVRANTENPAKSYSGSVRDWSVRVTTDDGDPVTSFMVDIDSLKQSYRVDVNGTNESEYQALYIVCPGPNQVIYPSFACKEVVTSQ